METVDLVGAAAFLKMHPEEVRRRARLGQLPGAKAGKRWVFIVDDLAAYLRSLYPPMRQALRVTLRKEVEDCHSTNAVARGRFTTPSGERVRCSARTSDKAEAQELHDQLRAEAWRVHKLGEKPRRTWDEAALKWLQESEKATIEEDKAKLRWLQPFLRTKYLDSIDREQIGELARIKAEQSSPATANRYLALIRAILRKAAFEWEWIDRVPKVKLYREAKRRIRWITAEQAQTLLRELPPHQVDIVLFALSTGLRQSNVLNLEWSRSILSGA